MMRRGSAMVWLVWCAAALGQDAGALRVSGAITQDATWRGMVFVTGDVQITGGTVTVEAGTTIEFVVGGMDSNPLLGVGTADKGGRLILKGTKEAPITLRSRSGMKAGCVRMFVQAGQGVEWAHANVEGLGYRSTVKLDERLTGNRKTSEQSSVVPAVLISAETGKTHVRLESVCFRRCGRLSVRIGSETVGGVKGCAFEDGLERVDLEIGSLAGGIYTVLGSRFGGVLDVTGCGIHAEGNIFTGTRAALAINSATTPPSRVIGNYIHNGTTADDGSYCLKSADGAAEIRDNVLRGGTYVVLNGSRNMNGNVLVSGGRLSSRVSKAAKTHYVVADLPAGAKFERNVLIGPAYALLATQAAGAGGRRAEGGREAMTIRQNVFDGLGDTSQAIRFNVGARERLEASIVENTFLRVATLVMDEARMDGTIAAIDRNIIAPKPSRPWEGVMIDGKQPGSADFGSGDRVFASVTEIGLAGLPSGLPEDWDAALLAGRMTIEQVRDQVRSAYRAR